MAKRTGEEAPVTCPHHGAQEGGGGISGPCPTCTEITRMLRDGEVPY